MEKTKADLEKDMCKKLDEDLESYITEEKKDSHVNSYSSDNNAKSFEAELEVCSVLFLKYSCQKQFLKTPHILKMLISMKSTLPW